MKKFLITCLSSFLIGGLFAFYVLKDFKTDSVLAMASYEEATVFQAGVFSSLESAQKRQSTLPTSVIMKDGDVYRIYLTVLQDEENVVKMKQYFLGQGVDIYLKKVSISTTFQKELNKIENLLKNSNNTNTYNTINKEILKSYESEEL